MLKIEFNKPVKSILDPKENNEQNAFQEKIPIGRQLTNIHSRMVLNKAYTVCWITRAQTPNPEYAEMMPRVPETITERREILALVLKSMLIDRTACWILEKENRKKIEDFLDFVINNVGCYLENEVYLIGKYLCNSGDTVFFRHMQQNRDKDNFFRDVRGMAWDL